jgi:hypothetical protein
MGKLFKFRTVLAVSILALALSGCGGEDTFDGGTGTNTGTNGGNGGGTGVPGSGAQTGTVANIAITYPNTDAIEKITGGLYRLKGIAFVTDIDGNTVPDGTEILFKIIDSVKATGTIDTGGADSITGAVLTDNGATLGDGITATTFDSAYVTRNNNFEFIGTQDQVFLTSPGGVLPAGFKADMARSVSSATGATVTVTSTYANTYPNVTYLTGTTGYVVGASHIGVEVAGADENEVLTTGIGSTIDGEVHFRITYPANSNTLGLGCVANDPRYLPLGSGDIYFMASNSSGTVAIIDEPCLSRISGGTLTSSPTTLSGSATFVVQFKDGGDLIPVPYSNIIPTATVTGAASVVFNGTVLGVYTTDLSGNIYPSVTIGGASGDTATITFTVAGEPSATVDVAVTIP